jgi:hypothetical protein
MSAVVLTIAQVAEVTARAYGVTVVDLKSKRRPEPLATARHVAMLLAYRLTRNSSPAIGRWFGARDHSTVLSAIKRTKGRMMDDPEFAADVRAVAVSATAVANSAYERAIGAVDALQLARRLARASDRDLMHASTQELAALALRVVEAQHALLDAARLVRGLASPRVMRDEPALAARAARLATALEALGVIEIETTKEAL